MPTTTDPQMLAHAVAEHTTVLPSPIEEAADTDLAALDTVIGDARVVAVGEATHFVAEFGATQRRLIRYLAQRHGFTVLAFEFGFAEAEPLDAWLHGHGDDDGLVLHRGPHAGFEATMNRWRWLREHNTTGEHPIRFVGLDTPVAGGTLRPVLEPLAAFLDSADPEAVELVRTAEEIAYRFEALSHAGSAPLWAELPAADRSLLTATLSRLSLRMNALRPLYLERTSTAEVDLARRHLDIALAADYMVGAIHALFQETGRPMNTSVRDRMMADSLLWHLERLGPEDRVVLLAHNFHIQQTVIGNEAHSEAFPLGFYLAEALGDDYRTIALTHTAETAPDLHPADNPMGFDVRDTPVAEPPPTSVEGALTAANLAGVTSVLPLGALRRDPRMAPASIGAQSEQVPTDVVTAFDAVINLPTATATADLTLH